ncbi:hypothetical protein ACJJTC_002086 [Scirpophaga incertulas]
MTNLIFLGQTIAQQLRQLPLVIALETEETILSVIRRQRTQSINAVIISTKSIDVNTRPNFMAPPYISIDKRQRTLIKKKNKGQRFHINGPDQIRPSNFADALKNIYFKEALVDFIIDDWANDYMAPFIGSKTILVNYPTMLSI